MNRSSFRLVVVADVGWEGTRHLGDEAMLEANLQVLRRLIPGVRFTVVGCDPAWIADYFGVDSVLTFGFSRDPSAGASRAELLDRLIADATSCAQRSGPKKKPGNFTSAITMALAGADALLVSGGGNLSSTWPDLLYERVALLQIARILGKRAVVVGQTIGPSLDTNEFQLLSQALSSARFVGVRERPSAALALKLGVPPERLWYQSDDALFLGTSPKPFTTDSHTTARITAPQIAVTIDPQIRAAGEIMFNALVSQLREISLITGARLALVPHVFGHESAAVASDLTEANLLAEALALSSTVVLAGLDAKRAIRVTNEASLVISTRYHPIVFGLSAGVPAIGIYGDEYCRIKLQGALAHAELERWTLTYEEVARGVLLPRTLKLWRKRQQIRRQIELHSEAWRVEFHDRWTAVLHALEVEKQP
ncbi:MAG TPA: polysaccharide pyruvyl transferase family protein [Pyrinomonadaceae bacterium]|nr:polysaccharide pyruvyl transferase family protein [Pyrinomonadaceae bacterium]